MHINTFKKCFYNYSILKLISFINNILEKRLKQIIFIDYVILCAVELF